MNKLRAQDSTFTCGVPLWFGSGVSNIVILKSVEKRVFLRTAAISASTSTGTFFWNSNSKTDH